jgi:hypothetical protein
MYFLESKYAIYALSIKKFHFTKFRFTILHSVHFTQILQLTSIFSHPDSLRNLTMKTIQQKLMLACKEKYDAFVQALPSNLQPFIGLDKQFPWTACSVPEI